MFRIVVDGEVVEICVYEDYEETKRYARNKYSEFTNNIRVEKCKDL